MRIRWSDRAVEHLVDIHAFIGETAPERARSFIADLLASVEKLEEFPRIGRAVPEWPSSECRELLWESYRILYRVRGEWVEIVGVIHGRRDLRRLLDELSDRT